MSAANDTFFSSTSTLPRNLPVKRYDGEPLQRADLQHNLLCHLFSDTTRCFKNPRPGPQGPEKCQTWKSAVPVYPYGMARTCSRRSDETDEERKAYENAYDAFEAAPFVDAGEVDIKKEEDTETAEGGTPPSLRAREGYPAPGSELLTFKELYIEALMHSAKCTKAMRDKIVADEEFAEDFAKVCLLVNVGRINTTLAFYPEMKTILRSYHPLPSLQRNENTRRHLQDAPRMKSLLKSVLLDGEKPGIAGSGTANGTLAAKAAKAAVATDGPGEETPSDLTDLVKRKAKNMGKPVTSVITLIFLLATQSSDLGMLHFDPPHDFCTIFFPHPDLAIPSKERARTFLWLVWHYLEGGATLPPGNQTEKNPFDDEVTSKSVEKVKQVWATQSPAEQAKANTSGYWKGTKNPEYLEYKKKKATQDEKAAREADAGGKVEDITESPPEFLNRIMAPALSIIDFITSASENVDSEDEKVWGSKMREERGAFLMKFQEEEQAKIKEGEELRRQAAEAEGLAGDKAKDKAAKKRNTVAGGGSSYPLANILAAANAEKAASAAAIAAAAAAANSGTTTNGDGPLAKRRRGSESAMPEDEGSPCSGLDKADTLWDLDLSFPVPTGIPPRGFPGRPQPLGHSLPRLAWRRILERAQRGVGDASYESEDESVALDEAKDERPRVEIARILRCLRQVRTDRGEITKA